VRNAKIQLWGHFGVDRSRPEHLVDQVVRLLREAIDTGRLAHGTRVPSTRALALRLGVSRNTVLTAYDELVSAGLIRGKRGAGMFVVFAVPASDPSAIMRDAQFPLVAMCIRDPDGNSLAVTC
jgi:DNA-binding GntR family transcriptional regulator